MEKCNKQADLRRPKLATNQFNLLLLAARIKGPSVDCLKIEQNASPFKAASNKASLRLLNASYITHQPDQQHVHPSIQRENSHGILMKSGD